VKQPLARARAHLNYANTMSTLAVFIALGGSAWAVTALPRNSVGSAQIRTGAVGSSEIRNRSIRSGDIRDRAIKLRDISTQARASLRGAPGPVGPPGAAATSYRAAVNSGGGTPSGNARTVNHQGGSNEYTVHFDRDVSTCTYSATLAAVQNGPTLEQPPAGRITVASAGAERVLVRTFGTDGTPGEAPFHLLVAC
jgi:hypothetical protein